MYFIYVSRIFSTYMLIRYLHGNYVSYYFLKWIITSFHSGFLWILSCIHKPEQQLDDKYNTYEVINDYILIK